MSTGGSSQPQRSSDRSSRPTSLISEAEKLSESLIPNPSSDSDYCHNLALIAVHQDLTAEIVSRQLYPNLSHAQLVRLRNLPEYLSHLDQMVNAETTLQYPRIMRALVERASHGDVAAFREIRLAIGLTKKDDPGAAEVGASVINQITAAMSQQIQKQKLVDVDVEVK